LLGVGLQHPPNASHFFGTLRTVYNRSNVTKYSNEKTRVFSKYHKYMRYTRNLSFSQMQSQWHKPTLQFEYMFHYFADRQGRANGKTCKKLVTCINSIANGLGKGFNMSDHPRFNRLAKGMNRTINYTKRTRHAIVQPILLSLWQFWAIDIRYMSPNHIHGCRLMRTICCALYHCLLRGATIFLPDRSLRQCDILFSLTQLRANSFLFAFACVVQRRTNLVRFVIFALVGVVVIKDHICHVLHMRCTI